MSQTELIDIFDAKKIQIGVVSKKDAHAGGFFHKSFHCWVINATGRVLLQKRSKDKKLFKGLFDVSAAGHYLAGERGADGVREVKEELGFVPDKTSLKRLCVFKDEYITENYVNREFCTVYACRCDTPVDEFVLNNEADGLASAELDKLISLFEGKTDAVSADYFDKKNRSICKIILKTDDFVPSQSGYYKAVLKRLEHWFKEKK